MSLRNFMTKTVSTKRHPAEASGRIGAAVANLTSVLITPLMIGSGEGEKRVRQAIGLEGSHIQLWRAYTESHTHTDSSVSVTQLPDIKVGDKVTVDTIDYEVQWADLQSESSAFGQTLILYLTVDK